MFLRKKNSAGGNMKLYMIKYIDLYTGRCKRGFFYTSLTSNIEHEFRRNYIGDITIESIKEIKNTMCICDVGEVYDIYESHTL